MERLSNRANLEGVQGREMKPEKMRPAKRRKKKKGPTGACLPRPKKTHTRETLSLANVWGEV